MIENKKPPVDFNTPIPNLMGSAEEVYYVDTPEGPAFLGAGLSIDPATGAISSSGGGISVTPLGANIYSLADLGNGTLLAGGDNGKIYRSANDGSTWDGGTSVGVSDSVMYSLVSGGGNRALAGSWDFTYPFVSANSGQSWAEGEDFNEDEIDGLGFAGGNTVYAGTYGYIHRSDDGGQTWPQSSPLVSDEYYMCFAFPGENKVVAGTYKYGNIVYSNDGGLTWDSTSNMVLDGATWIYSLASDSNGKVIAGTDDNGKVFLSEDSGETWDGGTLLGAATKVLSVAYGNGVFYAGTNDNGKIYRSSNSGASWSVYYNPNSINATVNALTVDSSGTVTAAINNFIVRIPAPVPYIYCTPQYGNLPVSYPPYGCNTEVNTTGVTDFTDAWRDCETITEFPCVDSSSVTDFSYAWEYCYGLTSFPTINTSAGTNFTYSWAYSGLTSFPRINTSAGTDFRGTWCGCYDLANFPELDLSKGEDFTYAWGYCESLTAFTLLEVSQGTSFQGAWYGCNSLTSFPLLDVSQGTDFSVAWTSCTSLTSFPILDVSQGTNFNGAWQFCTSLTSFPILDVSQGTSFNATWYGCTSLTSFPAAMFDNCSTNYQYAFASTWQNCALNQTSINNILISLDTSGIVNNFVSMDGGTSAAPSGAGATAKTSLLAKGWTVTTN